VKIPKFRNLKNYIVRHLHNVTNLWDDGKLNFIFKNNDWHADCRCPLNMGFSMGFSGFLSVEKKLMPMFIVE